MMFEVEVELSFSAAHFLRGYRGRCEGIHGHNWKVKATLEAERLNKLGMVMDFQILKKKLKKVLNKLDHRNLNQLSFFKKENPTSENIAKYIFQQLNSQLLITNYQLTKISVWETENSSASYSGK